MSNNYNYKVFLFVNKYENINKFEYVNIFKLPQIDKIKTNIFFSNKDNYNFFNYSKCLMLLESISNLKSFYKLKKVNNKSNKRTMKFLFFSNALMRKHKIMNFIYLYFFFFKTNIFKKTNSFYFNIKNQHFFFFKNK